MVSRGPENGCSCVNCVAKHAELEKQAKTPDRTTFAMNVLFAVFWLLWLVALASVIFSPRAEGPATGAYNPFDVLELTADATDAEIKKAFKRLSIKWCVSDVSPSVRRIVAFFLS